MILRLHSECLFSSPSGKVGRQVQGLLVMQPQSARPVFVVRGNYPFICCVFVCIMGNQEETLGPELCEDLQKHLVSTLD